MLEGLFFLSLLIGGIVSLFLAISYLSKGFDEGSKSELKRGGLFLTGAVVELQQKSGQRDKIVQAADFWVNK